MKNNNFPQPQNYPNNSQNKNPYRIQNYNYMFYLIQDNPQLYNLQNFYLQLYQLGLLQNNNQQAQMQNLSNEQNVQNILPFYYNIAYNNLLQLSLLNSNNNNSAQNQNLLPTINNLNNFNEYQNNLQNNQNIQNLEKNQNNNLLNQKRLNIEPIENINENKNIENNNINENHQENNIFSLNQNEIKNQNDNQEIKNIEKKDEDNNIEENNDISTTKKEEKKDENERDIKTETKKKKKKRSNYKDLLYDTLLEHIGEEKKPDSKKEIELEEEEIQTSNIHTKKKEKNKKSSNDNNTKNKQKPRNKNGKHSRKKQHKITLKNNQDILADLEGNKNNVENSKYTRVIFHGKDYKKTENINDFMKYNFDFVVDEQYETKKLITDYDQQHVDIKAINGNTNIYDNYNYAEQHLDEINNIWSRDKFVGDNDDLKKAINVIRDSFNERKIYTNEEKYLDIIKNNNYNIKEFVNNKN